MPTIFRKWHTATASVARDGKKRVMFIVNYYQIWMESHNFVGDVIVINLRVTLIFRANCTRDPPMQRSPCAPGPNESMQKRIAFDWRWTYLPTKKNSLASVRWLSERARECEWRWFESAEHLWWYKSKPIPWVAGEFQFNSWIWLNNVTHTHTDSVRWHYSRLTHGIKTPLTGTISQFIDSR